MEVGIVDREKLVNIADAVRKKTGNVFDMTLDDIASNITSITTSDNNAKFDFSESGSKSSENLLSYLTTVDLSGLDTSSYTNMYAMFQDCTSLTSLDLSGFDTGNVIYMSNMFNGCSSLTSLDVSNWNTSKVTDMNEMFQFCSSLTSLDLSNLDTSNVTSVGYMFYDCSSLTTLDLSNWNTSKLDATKSMFSKCSKLSNLTLGNDWASNSSIDSFDLSSCPLTRESAIDVINKLATRDNSPVIEFSNQVELFQSEIDIATNKGWSVSGCSVLVDAESATVGQYTLIDGVLSKCVYVADTRQDWGQRVFASQSHLTYSNGRLAFEWGGYGTATGITATAIGTGLSNTNSLIAMNLKSTDGSPTIWDALKEFRTANGDRWFIPSVDEGVESFEQGMIQMWTSSEYDSSNAYTTFKRNHHSKEELGWAYAFTYV